jgi:hypothetical protein
MASVRPEYTREEINKAARAYIDPATRPEDREMALAAINNWRSSHSYPLNALQITLRQRAAKIDIDPTVAQRIKRLPSIRHKLERFPKMKLSQMQDIGGCRAVLSSVAQVDELVTWYKTKSRGKHQLVREDPYIAQPKDSGYRGVHLVYSYRGREDWNGLKIELQIRSRLQHAWATAVETVGTFTRQALKSSQGQDEWLRFFALMSSALALREGTPRVPGTPEDSEQLTGELRRCVNKLKVFERLDGYGATLQHIEEIAPRRGHIFLLELDLGGQSLRVWDFDNAGPANEKYAAVERAIEGDPNKDAVLVTVESVAALRRAYPNYFLDTVAFAESVQMAVK